MQKNLISVIVPVYNIEEYLPRCVHSLTAQTYQKLEIILVDDGSTDATGELCDALAREDSRITVYHKENGGSSSARNLGISKSNGEYLGFVDSDDYVEPDMYERLYAALQIHSVGAAQIGRDEITPEGERLPDICVPPGEPVVITDTDFMRELLMHRGDCSFCTKLIHRSAFDQFEAPWFPEGILNEDFHLLIRMLPLLGGIVSLPGYGYHVFYRVGSNSRKESRENFSRVFGDCVDNADLVAGIVERDYPLLREEAFRFGIFQRLEYLLHIPISQMTAEHEQYRGVVKYLRRNWWKAMKNSLLTGKNKVYASLFALAPRGVRRVHRRFFLYRKTPQ